MLIAYLDESYDQEMKEIFVAAGFIARYEGWSILCESRSLRGVLEPLAGDINVRSPARTGRSLASYTTVGPALSPGQTVLYLGDLDFRGAHIESNTRTVLEEIVGASLEWERVAITQEQVEEYRLEPS
jgi:hypothetical protein